jgi:hypothetical protein
MSADQQDQDRQDRQDPREQNVPFYRLLEALDRPEFQALSCSDALRRLDPGGLRKRGPPLSSLLEGYITEKQLAELLRRTVRTLQIWRKERTGPPVTKIGATIFYEIEGVRAWLRSKSQPMPRVHGRRRQHSKNRDTA